MKKLLEKMKITAAELDAMLADDAAVTAVADLLASFGDAMPKDDVERSLLKYSHQPTRADRARVLAVHRAKKTQVAR